MWNLSGECEEVESLLKGRRTRTRERLAMDLCQQTSEWWGNTFPPSYNELRIGKEGQVAVFTQGWSFAAKAQLKSRKARQLGMLEMDGSFKERA